MPFDLGHPGLQIVSAGAVENKADLAGPVVFLPALQPRQQEAGAHVLGPIDVGSGLSAQPLHQPRIASTMRPNQPRS